MRVLILLLAFGWMSSRASASRPYFTRFGDQILSRSQTILRGRVDGVDSAGRLEVVRVESQEPFKGSVDEEVVVLANPGEFFAGSELLLFLELYQQGPRFTCFNRISTTDPEYETKEAYLREQLLLESQTDTTGRREMARGFLLEHAASEDPWMRWNMLRELAYVLEEYPDMLDENDAERLREIGQAQESRDARFHRELRALLKKRFPDDESSQAMRE